MASTRSLRSSRKHSRSGTGQSIVSPQPTERFGGVADQGVVSGAMIRGPRGTLPVTLSVDAQGSFEERLATRPIALRQVDPSQPPQALEQVDVVRPEIDLPDLLGRVPPGL